MKKRIKNRTYALEPHLDPDRLRERLIKALDKNLELTPSSLSPNIGIAHDTLLSYIHGAKTPQRKTLVKIYQYLENVKEKAISVHIALDKHEEPKFLIED